MKDKPILLKQPRKTPPTLKQLKQMCAGFKSLKIVRYYDYHKEVRGQFYADRLLSYEKNQYRIEYSFRSQFWLETGWYGVKRFREMADCLIQEFSRLGVE